MESTRFDLLVVGAGISGMTAAAAAASQGLRVGLVNSGFGLFVFGAGCVESQQLLPNERPEALEKAIAFFCNVTQQAGCPFYGRLGEQRQLPTMMGSFQSVALAPFYVWNSDGATPRRAAVVGIKGLSSFDARFVAERLTHNARRLELGTSYAAKEIALSSEEGTSTLAFANRFDRDPHFRLALQDALKPIAKEVDVIILPGILGQRSRFREISDFEQSVGCHLCEVPTLPPSVPGLRLFHALESHLRKIGVEFFSGFPVKKIEIENRRCQAVLVDVPARPLRLRADSVILASGQFSAHLLGSVFFGVDGQLRPITSAGTVIADNLYAAGALLRSTGGHGGNERAILTGYRAGMSSAERGGRHAGE
jgi:glycerol-3-phosphate dehydrogenase subunit B